MSSDIALKAIGTNEFITKTSRSKKVVIRKPLSALAITSRVSGYKII
jgi:hypothetical protein